MHMVLIQYDDHGKMRYLLQCSSLQVTEVRVMVPESLVHGHRSTIIQTSPRVLHMEGDHVHYAMQDTGILKFSLSMTLQHVGSKMVLSQSFNKGHTTFQK